MTSVTSVCVCELARQYYRGPKRLNTPRNRGPKSPSEVQSRSPLADLGYVTVLTQWIHTASVLSMAVCIRVCVCVALTTSRRTWKNVVWTHPLSAVIHKIARHGDPGVMKQSLSSRTRESRFFSINVQSASKRHNRWATSGAGHLINARGSALPESDCTLINSLIYDKGNRSVVFDGAVHGVWHYCLLFRVLTVGLIAANQTRYEQVGMNLQTDRLQLNGPDFCPAQTVWT